MTDGIVLLQYSMLWRLRAQRGLKCRGAYGKEKNVACEKDPKKIYTPEIDQDGTWKMNFWKRRFLSGTIIFRFHVSFRRITPHQAKLTITWNHQHRSDIVSWVMLSPLLEKWRWFSYFHARDACFSFLSPGGGGISAGFRFGSNHFGGAVSTIGIYSHSYSEGNILTNPSWKEMSNPTCADVVSTHLKNISQNGNLPQVGVKIKNIWKHHLLFKQIIQSMRLILSKNLNSMEIFEGETLPKPFLRTKHTPQITQYFKESVANCLRRHVFLKVDHSFFGSY